MGSEDDQEDSENEKYPKSIFLIIATEFCERFSFGGLRAILSLYLRNILLLHENVATYIYHGFIMLCYLVPLFGAVLADGFLGRFKTILYFSIVYTAGNVLMCIAATPPLSILPLTWTSVGLILIALGTGGIKPCVAAFGGDQFHLPRQTLLLAKFFSLFYFTINMGGLAGVILIPILRNIGCFHNDTCYSLGFGFPAALMGLGLILFILGKDVYRIKSPKDNVILKFLLCTFSALFNKCKNGFFNNSKCHWLNYASDQYDCRLLTEMKAVYGILWLYIPLPIFWALFDQQGSRWTFQASRMNGELFGFQMLPDQVQMLNPLIVLLLIPLMNKFIYPFAKRKLHFLDTPLERMALGGSITTLAFVFSGLLEIQLQNTYPLLPEPDEAPLDLINVLPCSVSAVIGQDKRININAYQNFIFEKPLNLIYHNKTNSFLIDINVSSNCKEISLMDSHRLFSFHLVRGKMNAVVLFENENTLDAKMIEPDIISKPLNGKPRIRVILLENNIGANPIIRFKQKNSNKYKDLYFPEQDFVSVSEYINLIPGRYYYGILINKNGVMIMKKVIFKLGGVYTLIVGATENSLSLSELLVMTCPNSVHMSWMIPQYLALSLGEVLFAISGLQFSYTEAPRSMRTVVIAAWYLTVAAGNLLVILITQITIHFKQSTEFFIFAALAAVNMVVFVRLAFRYQHSGLGSEPSTTTITGIPPDEHSPLLVARASVESVQ